MTPIRISASLVLYKPDLQIVERTLLALQEAGQVARQQYALQLELTLVDNSDDGVLHGKVVTWLEGFRARVPGWALQLLRAPGNLGYGRGNNLVIANVRSDYHIVINPDLFVEADAVLEALRFMEVNPCVGLLSPAVFGEDGERHYLCKRYPTLLVMFLRSFAPSWLQSLLGFVIDGFEMRDCDYAKPIYPLEYPTGCFMFFRTAPLKAIGGFDPGFFLHYEDADIGRRMLQNARVVYVPSVRVKHKWARDTHRSLQAMLVTARSGWRYWRKWGGTITSRPAADLLAVAPRTGEDPKRDTVTAAGRRVLVTGANGFVGQAVCAELLTRGDWVVGAVRRNPDAGSLVEVPYLAMGNIDEHTDWSAALSGVGYVVHLAGRAHQMRDTAADPLAEFRRVNVALTLNLARQAAILGVRRFVFISSIKAIGESTPVGQPFTAADPPKPTDPYGMSKLEAEQALLQLARQTGMEVVIIRPVLVYGPDVKANFHTMMRWVLKGIPLPLGALYNRRSFIALDNLADCIVTSLFHPAAANQTFLVSDGEDLTITDLLRRTAAAGSRPARLLPVPLFVLRVVGNMLGKEAMVRRLCDTLQVDITKTRKLLGWEPRVSVDGTLCKTVRQFRKD
jgi:nucleoside-diphosphate-sugar epimerase/GT2 family glycosyltransferase